MNTVSFSVDAGLINRLGLELVGRAETAVSELVKNSYDADATKVNLRFIDSDDLGGTLEIEDNGHGMTLEQLVNGFMRISSTSKIDEPRSPMYKRVRAGRKGIGRFATHRLGEELTIITQTKKSENAIKVTINWDDYQINQNIEDVKNPVKYIPKEKEFGTKLIIKNLRENWTQAKIERVFRYVSDLLQPDFLSDKSKKLEEESRVLNSSFDVEFFKVQDEESIPIAGLDRLVFDKAVAEIEGYIDNDQEIYLTVSSDKFGLESDWVNLDSESEEPIYKELRNVYFKAYYFVYGRIEYYSSISKQQLNSIQKISRSSSGIKLYRNGFRVLPYGEPSNDWLKIDATGPKRKKLAGIKTANAPFSNKNFFGFVEIFEEKEEQFEETSSREGLLETNVYRELTDFILQSLLAARLRIAAEIKKFIDQRDYGSLEKESIDNESFDTLISEIENLQSQNSQDSQNREDLNLAISERLKKISEKSSKLTEENEMLRVLASTGLTIGEFVHEIRQFTPNFKGAINALLQLDDIKSDTRDTITELESHFNQFSFYSSFFDDSISKNVNRTLRVLRARDLINEFINVIKPDIDKLNIKVRSEFYNIEIFLTPSHPSEWKSIFFNLYTNSKKAIKRASVEGKILILSGIENDSVYFEFHDNGDGVPEEFSHRIFDAFFTTSNPAIFDADNDYSGTGLGLKIVRDIIENRGGRIFLESPEKGYSTCFKIEMPIPTEKEIEEYGN